MSAGDKQRESAVNLPSNTLSDVPPITRCARQRNSNLRRMQMPSLSHCAGPQCCKCNTGNKTRCSDATRWTKHAKLTSDIAAAECAKQKRRDFQQPTDTKIKTVQALKEKSLAFKANPGFSRKTNRKQRRNHHSWRKTRYSRDTQ